MMKLIGNQRGQSLIEVVVGSIVATIVLSIFSQFMIFQAKNIGLVHQKAEAFRVQTVIERVLANTESCTCFFNTNESLNGLRNELVASPIGVRTRQAAGLEGPNMNLRWLSTVPVSINGNCDYGKAHSIAIPNEYIGDPVSGLMVERIEIRNIRMAGRSDASSSLHHMRGIVTVSFFQKDPLTGQNLSLRKIPNVETPVDFYTNAVGKTQTCDGSGEIKKFFLAKHTQFKNSVEGSFRGIASGFVETNKDLVPSAIDASLPEIESDYDENLQQGIGELQALLGK